MRYSSERKEAVLKKMLPPHNRSIREIAEEEGISEATLYNWRRAARAEGRLLPDGAGTPEGWTSADKFAAESQGARLGPICKLLGLHPRTLKRWRDKVVDGRPLARRPVPANKLSEAERQRIVQTCNLPTYAHLPPSQIVPMLLDEGIYLASESTFYRVLREVGQIRHRGPLGIDLLPRTQGSRPDSAPWQGPPTP